MDIQDETQTCKDRLEMLETFQNSMNEYRVDLDRQIIVMKNTLVELTDNKVNVDIFTKVNKSKQAEVTRISKKLDGMVSEVATNANFLQKYVPLQTQRAITHVLGFVFPQKDVAWRLNWYNELRMPMLTTALLTDEGKQNLHKKMDEINYIISTNPATVMEMGSDIQRLDEMTKDEMLLSNVLKSMKLHQKAKVVIFD